jgi:arylsulfatase A-like enzyme
MTTPRIPSRKNTFLAAMPSVKACARLLLWTGLVLSALACSEKPEKNLILITVDTLRPDRLGCYGFPLPTSPNLDRFARQAVVYPNVYAQASSTSPSLASMMTSRMPLEVGVPHNFSPIKPRVETLAEDLANKGFTTAAFVSNYVLRKGTGFEQGFQTYDDTLTRKELNRKAKERVAEDTTQAVLAWLDRKPDKPFFLWIHYQDPHGPYTPPSPYDDLFDEKADGPNRDIRKNDTNSGVNGIPMYQQLEGIQDFATYSNRYLGEIRYFDESFGRLMEGLEKSRLVEDSIIVFTADHGEGMGEHDYYFAHGEYLYEHQIRVPLMIKFPGRPGGKGHDAPVALLDLYPTLLKELGFDSPSRTRGMDLLDEWLIHGDTRQVISQTFGTRLLTTDRSALIGKKYKLICSGLGNRKGSDPREIELYDILHDPLESQNLQEDEPKIAAALYKKLLQELSSVQQGGSNPLTPKLDEETLRNLESLGY